LSNPEDRLGLVLADAEHQIELTAVLGVGAYGTVYRGVDLQSHAQYAVKALNRLGLDQRQQNFQDREIRLHYQASQHPNVVSMEKIFESEDCTFVVLEYCPEGDLFSKITEQGEYMGKDGKARSVFLQIVDAVRHCHSHGVYHRDLKPENILVKDDGWNVKLADFGLATQERITSDFGCGSTFYMSPECQQSNPKPYACYESAPNDVWSLGVVLVNLICGRNPWKRASSEDPTFRAFMRDRNFLQSILPISSGLNWILQRIFDLDPRRRISLDDLREYIIRCPQLGQEPVNTGMDTPPYSPVGKPVDASTGPAYGDLQPVPAMDPLPVQQFTTAYQAPIPCNGLLTPPTSAHGSPCQSQNTFPVDQATPVVYGPFANQFGHFIPSFQSWSRCGANLVPNMGHHGFLRNVASAF